MKLVILDRDGVINQDSDAFIKSPEEWIPIEGSLEAIARLNQAGILVAVASNQSGLARGLFGIETLNSIHNKMHDQLERVGGHLDGIFFCPHGPEDKCDCRKPRTGLYRQIADRFGIDLRDTPIIGDSLRDLEAGLSVGARPILVRTGKGEKTQHQLDGPDLGEIRVFDSLSLAVDCLIKSSHPC